MAPKGRIRSEFEFGADINAGTISKGDYMIANSGHDENERYRGGKAGDQTGGEYAVIPWYSRPWTAVLRYPNKVVAADIAYCARAGAENPMIGYDQNQRDTFWRALASVPNYDPAKITTPCESDCTCGVATCVKAAEYRAYISYPQKQIDTTSRTLIQWFNRIIKCYKSQSYFGNSIWLGYVI